MKSKPKVICIRPVGDTTPGLHYFVEYENETAMAIDNRARGIYRVQTTLVKMPDGTLENGAGMRWEIVKEDGA